MVCQKRNSDNVAEMRETYTAIFNFLIYVLWNLAILHYIVSRYQNYVAVVST